MKNCAILAICMAFCAAAAAEPNTTDAEQVKQELADYFINAFYAKYTDAQCGYLYAPGTLSCANKLFFPSAALV